MNRKLLHRICIAWLVFLGICIATYVTFKLTLGRSVLAGESRHDFGVVQIDEPTSSFKHTFKLTNRTSKTLNIKNIKPSCGCTTAEPNTRILMPGDVLELEAKLTLKSSNYKQSRITITFDDETFHNLWIEAQGRMRHQLTASTGVLPVQQNKPTVMVVFVEVWDDIENAPEPKIVADEGIEAEFTRWNIQHKGNDDRGEPARWSGRILVTQTAETIDRKAKLTLQFKDDEPVIVGIYTDREAVGLLDEVEPDDAKVDQPPAGDGD